MVVFHPRTAATRSLESVALNMLVCYCVPPPALLARRHSRVIPSSSPIDSPQSESAAATAALFFSPSKSRLACSNHRQETLAPGLRADLSQRSRIGRVAIYCRTVFYLLVMYLPIPLKADWTIASLNVGYYQLPPPRILGCLLVSRRAMFFLLGLPTWPYSMLIIVWLYSIPEQRLQGH